MTRQAGSFNGRRFKDRLDSDQHTVTNKEILSHGNRTVFERLE